MFVEEMGATLLTVAKDDTKDRRHAPFAGITELSSLLSPPLSKEHLNKL